MFNVFIHKLFEGQILIKYDNFKSELVKLNFITCCILIKGALNSWPMKVTDFELRYL